jgi:hypothetical protein
MSNANTQILKDDGQSAIIKVTANYTTTANTIVIPKNLKFANTSQLCLVSISTIQYSCDGTVTLTWDGSTPSPIYNFVGPVAGRFDAYIQNNAGTPNGNIVMSSTGSVNMILTLNKEQGYADAFALYDAGG